MRGRPIRHSPKRRSVLYAEHSAMGNYFITIDELKARIGTADCPVIFDTRRRPLFDESDTVIPTAKWRDHLSTEQWAKALSPGNEVVVYCVHGHNVSQCANAMLRANEHNARVLAGGIEGWKEAGGVVIAKDALPHRDEDIASTWVTRTWTEHASAVTPLACQWFIRRFIDRDARFLFVEAEHVAPVAEEAGGIPYGVPDATLTQEGDHSTFDALIGKFALNDKAVLQVANIVRGADVGASDLVPETSGVRAVLQGISAMSEENHRNATAQATQIFDALYAWQKDISKAPQNATTHSSEGV